MDGFPQVDDPASQLVIMPIHHYDQSISKGLELVDELLVLPQVLQIDGCQGAFEIRGVDVMDVGLLESGGESTCQQPFKGLPMNQLIVQEEPVSGVVDFNDLIA